MPWLDVIWIDGPEGNIAHVAAHGISPDEVEEVLGAPVETDVSETSGHPIVFGYTGRGRFLAVVFDQIDDMTVYPITAFDVED